MKKIFLGIIAGVFALASCDKITNPHNSVDVNSSLPDTPPTFRDSSATSGIYSNQNYKILLEDIMGHYCGNCPTASAEADSLSTVVHPGQVIVMEDHSGFFADTAYESGGPAQPPGLPAGAFSEDLRSVAGDYWQSGKFYNFVSWPQGIINRTHWSQPYKDSIGINPGNWVSTINTLFSANQHPAVTINIHDSCWVPQRLIGIQITVNLPSALSGTYYLQALIVEDSCLGWQVDDYTTPGDVPDFNHRYVLRSAVGNNQGTNYWGNQIPANITGASNSSWTTYLTYDFTKGENGKAANWNMAHCYLIAFVYNSSTNATPYQIVQAEEIRVE